MRTGQLEQAATLVLRAQAILARRTDWRALAAAVYRAEALLATTTREWIKAEQAFARAHELEHAHGFPYYEAGILAAWAELYFARNGRNDRARGLALRDRALTIFQHCAATQDIGNVRARQATFGVSSLPVPETAGRGSSTERWGAFGLTQRESEVAALIARGLANREIAEQLVIAEGTARSHVERILGKLGLRSRSQVAAFAAEHGLLAGRSA
ncbi:MAG: response regulator transcription factor [Chloroflexi bacterium]|nr:response regulator transcription factor [Chloroflexota bacterium]